jgi:hypothetical protein
MAYLNDLTNRTFGRLTVLKRAPNNKWGCTRWHCKCSCGGTSVSQAKHLNSGHTKSCGCLRQEIAETYLTTHDMSETPTYSSWSEIKKRCFNSSHNSYNDYGGRGISVCNRWRSSFANFYADMGIRPTGKSIDRIDNEGNYTPENCQWATPRQQCNNKRNNKYFTFNGETLTLPQWSRRTGIKHLTLYGRIKRGWSIDKALTVDPLAYHNRK